MQMTSLNKGLPREPSSLRLRETVKEWNLNIKTDVLVERKCRKLKLNNISPILPAVLDFVIDNHDKRRIEYTEEQPAHSHLCMYFNENKN